MENTLDLAAATPRTEAERKAKDRAAKAYLKALTGRARPAILATVGVGLLSGILLIVQAWFLATVLAGAIVDGTDRAALLWAFAGLAATVAVRAGLAWAQAVLGFRAAAILKRSLRRMVWERLTVLGPAWTGGQASGALAATLVEQIEAVEGYVARFLPQMALAVLLPLAILIAILPVHIVSFLALALTAPMVPLFMALVGRGAAALNRDLFRELERMGGHFMDRLSGLTTLVLFDRARAETEQVARIADDYRKATMRVLRLAFLSSAVLEFFAAIAVALVAVLIGFNLLGTIPGWLEGRPLTLFHGLFILLLAPDFYMPLRQLAQHYHDRATAMGAAEALQRLEEAVPPRDPAGRAIALDGPPALRFDTVGFDYGVGRPALADLSFSVGAGERLALVGPSGAGKSTVLALLLAFRAPGTGTIRVAGDIDLATVDRDSWLAHVAYVAQRPHVFPGTLKDNLLLADPDADAQRLTAAITTAGLAPAVAALPAGLDTRIGDRGYGLSGGQVQRLALARAVLSDARLIVLDEPTAGLDDASAAAVLEALDRVAAGRTVIVATHSPAVIRWAGRHITLAAPVGHGSMGEAGIDAVGDDVPTQADVGRDKRSDARRENER